jgi:hypothetical protein
VAHRSPLGDSCPSRARIAAGILCNPVAAGRKGGPLDDLRPKAQSGVAVFPYQPAIDLTEG